MPDFPEQYDEIPGRLLGGLKEQFPAMARPSPAIDRAVLNRARAHLARWKRLRLLLRVGGAAAAVVILSVVLWKQPARHVASRVEDINADGVVDIRDALALQRSLNDGVKKGHDVNRDGVTDRRDVDAIAMAAVRLLPGDVQ